MKSKPTRKAWEIDRELRLSAVPVDRRIETSQWFNSQTAFPSGDDLISLFWQARVPGSGAPEIPYVEMVEAMANRGYEMRSAEALLPEGLRLASAGDRTGLRVLTSHLLHLIHSAPRDPGSNYWQFEHPNKWIDILAAMDKEIIVSSQKSQIVADLEDKVHAGWLGQLAGGAFGTAIEGYHGEQITAVYGPIDNYITNPETINDDVTYELVFLDVFDRRGRELTSQQVGLQWVRTIPFGWSAEWIALQNLKNGILPPDSGRFRNPFSDWIGAQMRGMICGMLAPGWPLEAVRLAYIDAVVSHDANGIYGEMYAAALTSLSFVRSNVREMLTEALGLLPQHSQYVDTVKFCLDLLSTEVQADQAWRLLDKHFEQYNWIHVYPNIAADLLALWHCEGNMTTAFRLLAHAGLDVDCNAGLVGNILGVMQGVPERWSKPLGDLLETYIPGRERMSIRTIAAQTARLAQKTLNLAT